MPTDSATRTPLYPRPPAGFQPLAVILVVPARIPLWLAEFIQLAADDPWLQLQIVCDPDASSIHGVRRGHWLARLVLGTEMRVRKVGRLRHAMTPVGLDVLQGVTVLDIADVAELPGRALVLAFAISSQARQLAARVTRGGWEFGASLADPEYAGLGLLAAMLNTQATVDVGLELDHGEAGRELLAHAVGAGSVDGFALLRERAFRKLPALLLRAIRKQAMTPELGARTTVSRLELRTLQGPPAQGLRIVAQIMSRQFRRLRARHQHRGEPWLIALRDANAPLQPDAPAYGRLRSIAAPQGIRWADPHVFEFQGQRYIFAEEYADLLGGAMGKGSIVALQLHDDGTVTRIGTVLEEPWHLSYPQVFSWQEDLYMTVEASAAGRVPLLRLRNFPLEWEYVTDLISGQKCVDATLLEHGNRWYLFATAAEGSGSSGEDLFLFEAATPLGPFEPHPGNPVVSDVSAARPAGPIFRRGEKLYRPAQNGGPRYGAGIAFQEIVDLSPCRYIERTAGRLDPPGGTMDGCHTYSATDTVEVFDIRDRAMRG